MACLSYRSIRRVSTWFPVIAPKAAVVSDEMLASVAGLDVLRRGGNAADAALAMAACMQVLQPYATGIGGDCFALHYDARTKSVRCVDGCGRSPAALTLEMVESKSRYDWTKERYMYGLQATVPGAAKAWFYIATRFGSGKLSMSEVLAPAISYAENGFPMDHVKQATWQNMLNGLLRLPGGRYFLNEDNNVPPLGQILINRPLATLLKRLGQQGPQVVYRGCVADGIVDAVRRAGGVLSTEDLCDHLESTEPLEMEPASATYRGEVEVHTTTLPTQGAVLLEALNILNRFDLKETKHIPGQFEHLVVEALRHAIADGLRYIGDPRTGGSLEVMLSHQRERNIATMVKLDRRTETVYPEAALPLKHSGTTFVAAADEAGNVCGLIGSISVSFGCAVVEEHGFAVQRRGGGFNRVYGHPNCYGPRKKPYHTLMPVVVTDARSRDWLCTMGTMGGLIQTSVLAQVLLNMVELGLDPQQSLSKPRFLIGSSLRIHPDYPLFLEPSFPLEAQMALRRRGHTLNVEQEDLQFNRAGRAHILARATNWWSKEQANQQSIPNGSIWCGVDPRINSVALGY
ncbi:glutathione hydrolase-like YwrD proenzyme [Dermacentor variabilis]|uniref:glutathione hydrolase-like YwrD proenzyme n=1 Tax=Dermacentor variabilis TaxID=34621 RepID=UPI003F5BDDFB